MVVRVVSKEGEGAGQSHGDVAERGHDFVDVDVGVPSEVGEVVDTAVQGVVEQSSEQIGVEEHEPDWQILNEVGVTLAR